MRWRSIMRGEPSAWRCERRPQSSVGSAPGGSVNTSTVGATSPSTSVSTSPSISPGTSKIDASRSAVSSVVIGLVDTGGLDIVLLHQLAEILAVDIGSARRMGDVARVAPQQLQDVIALE